MKTEKFSRKPFTVEAVQVTAENMEDVAKWTKGTIHETPPEIAEKFNKPVQKWVQIEVTHSMNDRQTKAFIDDYVLFANRGFKIYTPKAFERNFERPSTREVKIHVEDNRHGDVDPGGRKPAPKPNQVFKSDGKGVPAPKMVVLDEKFELSGNQISEIINTPETVNVTQVHNHNLGERCSESNCTADRFVDGVHLFSDKTIKAYPEEGERPAGWVEIQPESVKVLPTGQAEITPAERAALRNQQKIAESS